MKKTPQDGYCPWCGGVIKNRLVTRLVQYGRDEPEEEEMWIEDCSKCRYEYP